MTKSLTIIKPQAVVLINERRINGINNMGQRERLYAAAWARYGITTGLCEGWPFKGRLYSRRI